MNNHDLLIARYPEVFHVTQCGTFGGIMRHGLRSARNLLELFEADTTLKVNALTTRREASLTLDHPQYGSAQLRDQIPLSVKRLASALTDMTVQEWLDLLNSLCFFWPTEARVERLLAAPHYAGQAHDVLVVETAGLVAAHASSMRLSAINTGATRPFAWPRGSDTFAPLTDFPLAERIARVGVANAVAEIAIDDAVPELSGLLLRVERWEGARSVGVAWERCE